MENLLTTFIELITGPTKKLPQKNGHDESEGDEGIDDEATIHATSKIPIEEDEY